MPEYKLRKLGCPNCKKSVITEAVVGSVVRQKCPRCNAVVVFWVCEVSSISRIEKLTATPSKNSR